MSAIKHLLVYIALLSPIYEGSFHLVFSEEVQGFASAVPAAQTLSANEVQSGHPTLGSYHVLLRQKIFGFSISLLFLVIVLVMLKNQKLTATHAWPWILTALVMAISSLWFENLVLPFTVLLGVNTPLLLILLLAVLFLMFLLFSQTIRQARSDLLIKNLAQELAIMRRMQNMAAERKGLFEK